MKYHKILKIGKKYKLEITINHDIGSIARYNINYNLR